MSLLDRLLGRTEPVTTEVKASNGMTGPGAFALDNYAPVTSFSPNQNRLMNEALALFRQNAWVALAERTIIGPILDQPWHLEDETGDTISDEPGQQDPPTAEELGLLNLLRKPAQRTSYRQLAARTLRHEGLAGNAFWYLDGLSLLGVPQALVYVNPVRLTPRYDQNGNLLGWMMDGPDNPVTGRAGREGVPFELDEIRQFRFDEPDFGDWGIGIPEGAQNKIELDRLATRHSAQVFASGGRLTGIVTPKAQSNVEITEEQWKSLVREWRNVNSDPESAKRLVVARGPVDFIATSADNSKLQLQELSGQGRDDILFSWGIPITQAGGSAPAGLNSGIRQSFDEATLWQKPIAYRLRPYLEVIQDIVDLWQNVGVKARFVLDVPAFDDDTPQFENANRARIIPLTVDQRREQVGRDPLDPKVYGSLGQAIFIDQTMVPIFQPNAASETTPAQQQIGEATAKATLASRKLLGLRSRLQPQWERRIRPLVQEHLNEQKAIVSDNVRERYAQIVKKPKDRQSWWNGKRWDSSLVSKLQPIVGDYGKTVGLQTTRTLRNAKAVDEWLDRVVSRVELKVGQRIVGINETTRDRVQDLIEEGLGQGLGPAALGDLIEDDGIFNAVRADLIARTEAAHVYNEAALGSYTEFGVREVEAVDGDQDEECAARDGQTFSVDEAEAIEDHPNGTLDWIPIADTIEEKASLEDDYVKPEDLAAIQRTIAEAFAKAGGIGGGSVQLVMPQAAPPYVEVNVPEQVAPIVNVHVPEQQPTPVTVNVPEQPAPVVNVPAAKADLPARVEVVSMPDRVHQVLRDEVGKPKGSFETDA